MTHLERHDGIAVVRLRYGKANALDVELCANAAQSGPLTGLLARPRQDAKRPGGCRAVRVMRGDATIDR